MNRILAAVFVWILCFLAISRLATGPSEASAPEALLRPPTTRDATLEITASFAGEPDPFAVEVEKARALEVFVDGKPHATFDRFSAPDLPMILEVPIASPPAEIRVAATPMAGTGLPAALRIRIFDGGTLLAEQTSWSEGGGISISVTPEIPGAHGDADAH